MEHVLPRTCRGRIAVDGSLREILIKFTACGWPVVQMDSDGWDNAMVRSGWNHVSFLQVQRTIKRAEICVLYMVLIEAMWAS